MRLTRDNFMRIMQRRGFRPHLINPTQLAIAVRWVYGLPLPRPCATWVKAT